MVGIYLGPFSPWSLLAVALLFLVCVALALWILFGR